MIVKSVSLVAAVAVAVLAAGCTAVVSEQTTGTSGVEASAPAVEPKSKLQELGATLRADQPSDVPERSSFGSFPAVVDRVPTTDKVVFLTLDDGASKSPGMARILSETGIPVTAFLTRQIVVDDPQYFGAISDDDGQTIQNHSWSHPQMPTLSDAGQQQQICDTSAEYATWFGKRPWMFRPPYGEYNSATKDAAQACGIDYLVLWRVSLPSDLLRYAEGDSLKSGDIILTHWREDLPADFLRTLRDIQDQGFKVAALQDYLPRTPR